jgi:hypothetical protein
VLSVFSASLCPGSTCFISAAVASRRPREDSSFKYDGGEMLRHFEEGTVPQVAVSFAAVGAYALNCILTGRAPKSPLRWSRLRSRRMTEQARFSVFWNEEFRC